jgi:thiol:disulfide interchange protein DsbD
MRVTMVLAALAVGMLAGPRASVELVSSRLAIRPGETFTVALHMKMPEGWHAYYVNPGESGAPPKISWKLPSGLVAGPIEWPTPERMLAAGVAGNVYSRELWLPVSVMTAKTLPVGKSLRLSAKATWLLCSNVCEPDSAELETTVRVAATSEANPFGAKQIEAALALVPPRWSGPPASAWLDGKTVLLSLAGLPSAGGLRFFGADPKYFAADEVGVRAGGSGAVVSIPLSRYAPGAPKRLTGIVAPAGGHSYFVDVPIGQS